MDKKINPDHVNTNMFYLVRGMSIYSHYEDGQKVIGLNEELKQGDLPAVECILPWIETTISKKTILWYAKRQRNYKGKWHLLPVLLYSDYKQGFYITHTLCLFDCIANVFLDMPKGLQMRLILEKPELMRN